jgi:exodeoxyribonuclease V alpha subunit
MSTKRPSSAPAELASEHAVFAALAAPEPLSSFNAIGVLSAADIHVAMTLAELAGGADVLVQLAVAFAVRAPRLGHVFVDLETIRDTAAVESDEVVDISQLPWPEPRDWIDAVRAVPALVTIGEDDVPPESSDLLPLRLIGPRLYLDRYWREERQVASDLAGSGDGLIVRVDLAALSAGVPRLFAGQDDHLQRCAAACAVLRRLTVIAGGPGTGKTTTVARVAALLYEQTVALGAPPPLVALTSFTGKASARLQELVHSEAQELEVEPPVRAWLLELRASTIHRLLGRRPGSHTKFRHDRTNYLPHDVVIADETSMVSLSLMTSLLAAVRPEARVVLVGDPGQLTAIEAGAVLRDIVGPATDGLVMGAAMRSRLADAVGAPVAATKPPAGVDFGDGIIVLERVHRYGEAIASVADAIRRGDGERAVAALRSAPADEVTWIEADVASDEATAALDPVRAGASAAAASVLGAARRGDALTALEGLNAFRILCAHRRGPHGVAAWTAQIEQWLAAEIDDLDVFDRDYAGRPLLVTHNDYELGLRNGDTGVIVADPDGGGEGRLSAAFERGNELLRFTPSRLDAVETVYAMTIHKSQGSQFTTAAVLLPDPASRILTRELLYTAVTRARTHLILAGTEEMVRAAVARPVARASGLRERLWESGSREPRERKPPAA